MSGNVPRGLPPLSEKARARLMKRSRSWFWKRRLAAVQEIAARNDESLAVGLVARLADSRTEVRLAARQGFLALGPRALETLIVAAQIPGVVGARAVTMLRSLQFPNARALRALFCSENNITRSAAIEIARKLGKQGVSYLMYGLVHELGEQDTTWKNQQVQGRIRSFGRGFSRSSGTQDEIRKALISLGPNAAEVIAKYLGHPSILVRNEALLVLSRFGDTGFLQILKRGMRLWKEFYASTLGRLLAEERAKHVPTLARLCGADDRNVRLTSMIALEQFGMLCWPAFIQVLQNLADPDEKVAKEAAKFILRFVTPDPEGSGSATNRAQRVFYAQPGREEFDAHQRQILEAREAVAGLLRNNPDWAVRTALNGLKSTDDKVRMSAAAVLNAAAPHASETSKQLAASAVVFTTLGENNDGLKKLYETLLKRLGKLGPDGGGLSFLAA